MLILYAHKMLLLCSKSPTIMLKIFPESLIFLPKIKYNCLRYAYMDMDDYMGNINETQTPSHPTWPCLFLVVSIVTHNSPQEIRNSNFKNVRNSIFDTFTYFREFFLLLCWRNA